MIKESELQSNKKIRTIEISVLVRSKASEQKASEPIIRIAISDNRKIYTTETLKEDIKELICILTRYMYRYVIIRN